MRWRVGAWAVSALAKRICTPGMPSTTAALLRLPAVPPKVLAYQACAFGISLSGTNRWTCSFFTGTVCVLSSKISMRTPSGVAREHHQGIATGVEHLGAHGEEG